ncbi:MAG TPA: VOC family protein [Chitinophagales bacterium]|nr:VOC family protein [Chitinophagales bacterium]
MKANKITPFLWYDYQAEEAAFLYTSIFKNSKIKSRTQGPDKITGITFELDGVEYNAFNGGPHFKLNESFSLMVTCDTQEEVDYYWNALTANGGQESMCGWLKDPFGLSWQITPTVLTKALSDVNRTKANAAMQAMLSMKKLDVAELERAYNNA